MAGSLNKIMLIGRLGQDPELRYTASGTPVGNFSLATDEGGYFDKASNQKVERTEWHRVVAWNQLGELCNKYLSKGRLVYVEGRLQTRKWQDKQGQDRYTTEVRAMNVQFLESAPKNDSAPPPGPGAGQGAGQGYTGPLFPSEPGEMDDAPF